MSVIYSGLLAATLLLSIKTGLILGTSRLDRQIKATEVVSQQALFHYSL